MSPALYVPEDLLDTSSYEDVFGSPGFSFQVWLGFVSSEVCISVLVGEKG